MSASRASKTLPIQAIPAFRWVDLVLTIWPVARLPILFACVALIGLVPHLLSGNIAAVAGMVLVFSFDLMVIAVWVILARSAQADLEDLERIDLIPLLAPDRREVWIETIAPIMIAALPLSYFWCTPIADLSTSGWRQLVVRGLMMILLLWGFVILSHVIMFYWRYARVVTELAREIPFTLLRMNHLQALANPALRYLFLTLLSLVPFIVIYQFLDRSVQVFIVDVWVLPLALAVCGITTLFLRPSLIIRQRIRERKRKESEIVLAALEGDRSLLGNSEIGSAANEFNIADLLYYEERIQRVWEWPVQQHIRKFIFYLLIPPLAWILAALVERSIDFYLG